MIPYLIITKFAQKNGFFFFNFSDLFLFQISKKKKGIFPFQILLLVTKELNCSATFIHFYYRQHRKIVEKTKKNWTVEMNRRSSIVF